MRLARDVVLADAVDTLLHPPAWRELTVPTRFLAAEWSAGRDSAPAYPDAAVATNSAPDCRRSSWRSACPASTTGRAS